MKSLTLAALAASMSLTAAMSVSAPARAAELSMWVRDSAYDAAKNMIDLWNATHEDQINLSSVPGGQLVTKIGTGVLAGEVPDLLSFDLIYMPDFMKAGFLVDVTDQMNADPNYPKMVEAYSNIARYEGRIYGTGFIPDVSILAWNKDLFEQAGLDPEKGPTTVQQIHEYAAKIGALGDDIYGFYFSGACPGCNIFVTSPLMVAGGAKLLPAHGEDTALEGDAVRVVLDEYRQMWEEGLIPESAEIDTGQNFVNQFTSGKVGIIGSGGFLISVMAKDFPDIDYGIGLLPGIEEGQVSAFVGGDVVAIPVGSPNEQIAREFLSWVMTDEAQLEGLAKNNILPARTDLADNEYFVDKPKVVMTAKALAVGYVPWVFHFNTMVNSDSSPWINMLQQAIFDGDVDGAIEFARAEMLRIAGE